MAADVVAAHVDRPPVELAEAEPGVGAAQRQHGRRLAHGDVVEHAERGDHHPRQQQALEREPPTSLICSSADSSDARPVRSVIFGEASASTATRTRLTVVPSIAARLFGPSPCASEIVSNMTASEPTMATASGDVPSRIAGMMKQDDHGEAGREPDQRQRAA